MNITVTTARFNWLSAWRTYRQSGFLRCASVYGRDAAVLCSEVNIQRHNPPFPYAPLRDRLRCYKFHSYKFDSSAF